MLFLLRSSVGQERTDAECSRSSTAGLLSTSSITAVRVRWHMALSALLWKHRARRASATVKCDNHFN